MIVRTKPEDRAHAHPGSPKPKQNGIGEPRKVCEKQQFEPKRRTLSREDKRLLAQLKQKWQLIRDRTTGVAMGFSNGFYLSGSGGIGKSFTVLGELRRQQRDYKLHNSRMTGRGLYDALEEFPNSVHVLEDIESIISDRVALGVLRSALWGQRPDGGAQERLVTWSTARETLDFIFTGGIIMINNRPLPELPEVQAIRTRIPCLELHATGPEMQALMRSVSLKGFEHGGSTMGAAACLEVCEYIIEESRSSDRSLDMRLLVTAFADYLQWQEFSSCCHWKDLVASRLRECPTEFSGAVHTRTRTERIAHERALALQIMTVTKDRAERSRQWNEKTGMGEKTLYRRMAEVRGENGSK